MTPIPPTSPTTGWSGSFNYRVLDGTSVSPAVTVDVRNTSPVAGDFEVVSDTVGTFVHLRRPRSQRRRLTFEVAAASGVTVGTPDPVNCGVHDRRREHLHVDR